MVISEDCSIGGSPDCLVIDGGAVVDFIGTVDGDIVVKDCSTLRFDGVLLGKLLIEEGCTVVLDGIACEDNLPTDVDYTLKARLVPSGYRIVKMVG